MKGMDAFLTYELVAAWSEQGGRILERIDATHEARCLVDLRGPLEAH